MTSQPSPTRILPALLGFAFIAAWAQFSFLTAVACLLVALAAQLVAGLVTGETSLAELRARAEAARSGFNEPTRTRATPPPPAPGGGVTAPPPAAAPTPGAAPGGVPAPPPRPPRNLK